MLMRDGTSSTDASTSATFLIYGQLKHDAQSSEEARPKLELLATRRKAPSKLDLSRGHAVPKPGEPLPRGESHCFHLADSPADPIFLIRRSLHRRRIQSPDHALKPHAPPKLVGRHPGRAHVPRPIPVKNLHASPRGTLSIPSRAVAI